MEFTDIDNLEFWSILTNLNKLYRKCTKNKTYKLNINHTNTIRPYGECSKVTCNYLLISSYLDALLYIFIKTKKNTMVTTLQASSKTIAFIRLWPKAGLVLN